MRYGKAICCLVWFLTITALFSCRTKKDTMLPQGAQVNKILVLKSKRELVALSGSQVLKIYKVALGKVPVGAKQFEGDNKTPEGIYYIYDKNPGSKYHKNLGVSYPNIRDIANAKKAGKPHGGNIKIHGLPDNMAFAGRLQSMMDWTAGCIAMNNDDIDELYAHTAPGTDIEIRP